MCLVVNKNNLRVLTARKDMVVYKVLCIDTSIPSSLSVKISPKKVNVTKHFEVSTFLSEPQKFKYKLDVLYSEVEFGKPEYRYGKYVIHIGFHAYTASFESLKKSVFKHYKHSKNHVVVKCIIPKGAKYYLGTNNGTTRGICANKIILTELIEL